MGKKVISFALSESEIEEAIRELKAYKDDITRKTEELREKVAQKIADISQSGFNRAVIDDLIGDSARLANVKVSTKNSGGNVTLVIADGKDAIWAEFGSGVFHNGTAGNSPHPRGAELGFTIGSYGTKGTRQTWGFYEEGELRLTHGAPATMPMYKAMQRVCDEISVIAKEVFR